MKVFFVEGFSPSPQRVGEPTGDGKEGFKVQGLGSRI